MAACCGAVLGVSPDAPIVLGNIGGVTVQVVAVQPIAGMLAKQTYWVTGTMVARFVAQNVLAYP